MSMNEAAITDLSGGAGATDALAGLDGGLLDNFGIDSPTALDTPLPADAALEAGAEEGKSDAVAAPPAEVADKVDTAPPPPAPDQAALDAAAGEPAKAIEEPKPDAAADPDLSVEDKRIVDALPEADRAAGAQRMKAGSFYSNFKNPQNPIASTTDELFRQSEPRARELQADMVGRAIADPVAFAKDQFAKDPVAYGQFVSTVFNHDPSGFFVKELTGRDGVTKEQVREALDFHAQNKDRITEDQDTQLSADELKDLEESFPESAGKIKAILAQPTKQAEKLRQVEAELATLKGSKEQETNTAAQAEQTARQAEQQRVLSEQRTIEDESYGTIKTAVLRDLMDAPVDKGGLGLAISAEERTLAPEVVHLKETIRGLLEHGGAADMKTFETDFGAWGEKSAEAKAFEDAGKAWSYYVNNRDKANAIEVAQTQILPYAKTYFGERAAHPTVKFLLNQLQQLTAKAAAPPPAGEKFVPGQAPGVAKKGPASLDEFLDDFTPDRS